MTIPNISTTNSNSFYTQIAAPQKNEVQQPSAKPSEEVTTPVASKEIEPQKTPTAPTFIEKADRFIDSFSTNIKNPKDINDTVTVPRNIFKGYLSFMIGTTFMTIGAFMKKGGITNKALNIIGLAVAAFGTFNFVKPYVLGSKQEKEEPKEETKA